MYPIQYQVFQKKRETKENEILEKVLGEPAESDSQSNALEPNKSIPAIEPTLDVDKKGDVTPITALFSMLLGEPVKSDSQSSENVKVLNESHNDKKVNNFKEALISYLRGASIEEDEFIKIFELTRESTNEADLASKVLNHGNKIVNGEVKSLIYNIFPIALKQILLNKHLLNTMPLIHLKLKQCQLWLQMI